MARIPKKIYEDEDILVISKPPHLAVQPADRGRDFTLRDWLREHYPALRKVGAEDTRGGFGIVHRLDRETSGAMIVAKNRKAYDFIKNEFKEQRAHKTYHAIVYGVPDDPSGTIEAPIGKSKHSPVRRTTKKEDVVGRMRPAITDYKVVTFHTAVGNVTNAPDRNHGGVSLVEVRPRTGRTHQIRVHFAFLRHPIVCDTMYASKKPCLFGLKRAALHAFELIINLPSGEQKTFQAPYPLDFEKAVENFR